ncbi:YebC/PmpR family DNA-binding transcriptional regulator [Candidatus Uhrbacteria bacterium]|nr:YebC/PmpR family DNA-binding transcriptional regulator [Candidatus Uhrbacteria bacterium]
MSGHSKWATTKRQKAVVDAKRASVFTRFGNAITIAARDKGGDPETNFSLRLAIEHARGANMPKENIERAVKRGTGDLEGETLEEILYEGFAPEGLMIIIETLTNNRNRTVSELKHLLSSHGGGLGAAGSALWNFEKKGVVGIATDRLTEDAELAFIEAGAEDIKKEGAESTIIAPPEHLQAIKSAAESLGIQAVFAEFDYIPKNNVSLSEGAQITLGKLTDALDEHSDIINYYTNQT